MGLKKRLIQLEIAIFGVPGEVLLISPLVEVTDDVLLALHFRFVYELKFQAPAHDPVLMGLVHFLRGHPKVGAHLQCET